VTALASWLDARVHNGQWLVRIEDVDSTRCIAGADNTIIKQLASCGLVPDQAPSYQSQRSHLYEQALNQLIAIQSAYPCGCSRKDIAQTSSEQARERHSELIYPNTCRDGLHGKPVRAWRFCCPSAETNTQWHDRCSGQQSQNVVREVGDFVLKRADGLWAYQLAVVVDDGDQSISHIVRGQDLADNTARQILLQRALQLPTPSYLHVPLVLGTNGEKLSKQNGAQALDLHTPLHCLQTAAKTLGLPAHNTGSSIADWLAQAVAGWKNAACNQGQSSHARTI
jgi:glutamyl-Q tRNA(Asp) synthetase